MVNPEKSNFVPSQRVLYLGMILDSARFRVSLSQQRIEKSSCTPGFSPLPPGKVLLGTLSSLSHLVLGGRLRIRSLQLTLHHSWDRVEDSALIRWDDRCKQYLSCWLDPVCPQEGVSLAQVSPT